MFEELDKAAETLGNAKAGWVFRRDAADALGKAAAKALSALHARREDKDVDVRGAVERALREASAGLSGVKPESGAYTLEELARSCEKAGHRKVKPEGDGFAVEVRLKNQRRQIIYLRPEESKDGVQLIRAFTYCGKPSDKSLEWALRTNMQLFQGALALAKEGDEDRLVITNCLIAGEATPAAIKATVKKLAFYGDWIEEKLSGLDQL